MSITEQDKRRFVCIKDSGFKTRASLWALINERTVKLTFLPLSLLSFAGSAWAQTTPPTQLG